jgi:phosphoglycolate phosphatase
MTPLTKRKPCECEALTAHILFDLDGTLTDSAEGITESIRYAIESLGGCAPLRAELEAHIGFSLNRIQRSNDQAIRIRGSYRTSPNGPSQSIA